MPLNPHITNTAGNYFNSNTWSVVSANYTANGGENHLIIGNFKEDQNTTTVLVNPSGLTAMAYCYVDNVSLVQIPPCTTGITEEGEDDNVKVYPNPMLDILNIAVKSKENTEIILFDITYKKIIQQVFTGFVSLNIQELSKGSYFYEVRSKVGLIKKGKIIK